jgi:hypothetical protein
MSLFAKTASHKSYLIALNASSILDLAIDVAIMAYSFSDELNVYDASTASVVNISIFCSIGKHGK